MPSVTVSWLLQAAPKTLAINAKFGQPELDSNSLSSGHNVVPLRRQGQLATTAMRLGVFRATCRAGLPEEEGQERDTEHHRRHNRRHGVIRPVRGRSRGLTLAVLLHEAITRQRRK